MARFEKFAKADAMGDDVLGNFENAPPRLRGGSRKKGRRGRRRSKRP